MSCLVFLVTFVLRRFGNITCWRCWVDLFYVLGVYCFYGLITLSKKVKRSGLIVVFTGVDGSGKRVTDKNFNVLSQSFYCYRL